MALMFTLLSSLSLFASPRPVPTLELPAPWKFLPNLCQQRLLNSSDSLRARTWLKQMRASGDERLSAVVADATLWPHWKVLALFDEITWSMNPKPYSAEEKLGGFTQSALGPMYLSGSHDSGGKTSLWVDFIFANEPESRSFHERLKTLVGEAVKTEFPGRAIAPARVFDFDSRTHSVLLLLSDDFDRPEKTSLEALDQIAEFNARLVRRVLETKF